MTDTSDVVAIGLDLEPETLIRAYQNGVFPWPTSDGEPLLWFCPKKRAILEFQDLHIPRRLVQYLKKSNWTYTQNQSFTQVIQACSERGEDETWITPKMQAAYIRLHELGFAHSYEVWEDNELIGGIYGVEVNGVFAGESMFHRKPNASKAALLFAIECLSAKGQTWMDIQVMTPHMEALGAKLISRNQFLKRLIEL